MRRVNFSGVNLFAVLVLGSVVNSEPPAQNSGGGWGQISGTYSQGYNQQSTSGGYESSSSTAFQGGYGDTQALNTNGGGGWSQPQPQLPVQIPVQSFHQGGHLGGGGSVGGWQQMPPIQPAIQPVGGGGGWAAMPLPLPQKPSGGDNGWTQNQNQGHGGPSNHKSQGGGEGKNGWGPGLQLELDTANLSHHLNPANLFKSITGLPRKIVHFIRESGLYLLFIPLLIILPLMLLAFNAGRLLGGLGWGWGWTKRSLANTVESGIVGYMKSPIWQKIGETLMDEHVFDNIMKSVDKFKKKDW